MKSIPTLFTRISTAGNRDVIDGLTDTAGSRLLHEDFLRGPAVAGQQLPGIIIVTDIPVALPLLLYTAPCSLCAKKRQKCK